jgi:flagellar motor switch protein FliG
MLSKEYYISNRKPFPARYNVGTRPLRTSDRRKRDTKKALTGKQKAAMLLMSLDTVTASELLKGVDAEVVQELAAELAHLDTAGSSRDRQSLKLTRQFCNSLQTNHGFRLKGFLKALLKSAVGNEKTEQIQTGIQELLCKDDPFISIRSADSQTVATILENEHPQTAAVVLSELPEEKNSEVLSFLDWRIRVSVVNRLSSCGVMSAEAKTRIAETVCRRLEAVAAPVRSCESKNVGAGGPSPTLVAAKAEAAAGQSEPSLRKLAVVLRNLGKEIRDGLLSAIQGKNRQAGETVADLMIVWEDIPQIADRSMKEALRRIDVRKLGLALVKADDRFFRKMKSNISEPMAVMLEEEAMFMSAYKKKDIEEAREEIVRVLREMNERDELAFIEEGCNV